MIVEVDGQRIEVPDDATADEIGAIAGPPRSTAPGRGDLQLAERRREVVAKAENVPAHLLTGYPIDQQRAEAAWEGGQRSRPLTGRQAAQGMALLASVVAPALAAGPAGGGAIGGGLTALGTTDAENVTDAAKETVMGAATGAGAGKALSYVGGKVVDYAGKKLGAATAKATAEKAAERTAANRSADALRRQAIAEHNRAVEVVRDLLERESTLGAPERAALEAARASPAYAEAVNRLAQRAPERLVEAGQHLQTAEQAVASARALPSVSEMVAERLSPSTARRKVMDRLVRYGPPALGSAIGASIGGPAGVAVGALAGAGTRPAIHALRRMAQDPAVQTQMWTPVEKLAAAMAAKPGAVAGQTSPALSDPLAELLARVMGRPSGLVPAVATEGAPK